MRLLRRSFLLILAAVIITGLPLLLWRWRPAVIRYTYSQDYQAFELFGFSASAALFLLAGLKLRQYRVRQQRPPLAEVSLWLIPLLLLFHYLSLISEYAIRSWDYDCYEVAAAALLVGDNPYGVCYLYPPLLAQVMAGLFQLIDWSGRQWGTAAGADTIWYIVFYLFHTSQFYLIGLAYWLNVKLARRLGLRPLVAAVLVACLLLFNVPLLRTLRHNQVNLWLLDLMLLAILVVGRYPWLSGAAVALGTHLKLYPAVLLLPWTLARRWRAVFFSLAGIGLVVLWQAGWGQDWTSWQQFLSASAEFPRGTHLRDNSLHSLVYNTILRFTNPAELGRIPFRNLVLAITLVLTLAAGLWLARRWWQREKVFNRLPISGRAEAFRAMGHAADAIAATLIMAPLVWEHHFILAVPILIWAVAGYGRSRPWLIGLSALLMLAVSIFDFYPFSYHRLVGLLLLLAVTPANRPPDWASAADRPATERDESLL
jgi:hypothetical protein